MFKRVGCYVFVGVVFLAFAFAAVFDLVAERLHKSCR